MECGHPMVSRYGLLTPRGNMEWCRECGSCRMLLDCEEFADWIAPNRVPGPLAAGPGGSGLTRGASDAEKGVEADSQSRPPVIRPDLLGAFEHAGPCECDGCRKKRSGDT